MAGPPQVDSITPSSGPESVGTPVTISGSSFSNLIDVQIRGISASSQVGVSDNEVTCTTPALSAGTADVVVITASGSGILPDGYTYTPSGGGGPVMATVYSVERTLALAGTAQDARRVEGAKIEMRMLTYTFASTAVGTVVEGIPIYKGEIPVSFLIIHAALGTSTIDVGITGGDTNALLDTYSVASAGTAAPTETGLDAGIVAGSITAGSSGSLGIPSTVDDTIDIVTTGLGTLTGKLILMVWFSTLP